MNIIEAREAAIAGKTVIGPNGLAFGKDEFDSDSIGDWSYEMVFGEWSVKQEPVVFETKVCLANESMYGSGVGLIYRKELRWLLGKRVKVTVEVIDDQA